MSIANDDDSMLDVPKRNGIRKGTRMKTKWVATITVAILAVIVSAAFSESRPVENERQKRFDRNRDGRLDDREQAQLEEFARTSERAEKMRAEAKEHEEIARKLKAESEELASNLDREFQPPQRESAEREESADIQRPEQSQRDQQRAQMKEKAAQLRQQAQKAKQQGRHDQANQLLAQSEELTRRLENQDYKPGPEEYIRNLKNRLKELDQASDRAAQAGNPGRAQALRQQAEQARRDLDAANRRVESSRIRNEIRELGIQADKAHAAGNREKAAAIRKEAATLKQRLGEMENQPRQDRPRRMPHEPFPGQMAPYAPMYQYPQMSQFPQMYGYPQRSPYGYQPYGPQMDLLQQNGLPVDLEQLRQQVFQLRRMLEEFYQMAGESPEY